MNIHEARQWLYGLAPLGVILGTERVAEVLRRLGDPQRRFAAIHIAGTNGKGSTAAFSASLLLSAAREVAQRGEAPPRIGLFTSPHLLRLTERVRLSDPALTTLAECGEDELAAALTAVREAAEADPAQPLTFFEVLTAAGFFLFAHGGVKVAVIEVGLGGRLDATRLCEPVVTVVTSIGMDHMEFLGPTLADIAREKAGIFRRGVPACFPCVDGDAGWVLLAEAARSLALVRGRRPLPPSLRDAVPLSGRHQFDNAALAVQAVQHVPPPLSPLLSDPQVIRRGLQEARWPGRLERLSQGEDGREIWVDAAHNPEGAQALAAWLAGAHPGRPLTVLFGVVSGKQAEDMLGPLATARALVLTRPPSPRGRDPQDLVRVVRAHLLPGQPEPEVVEDVAEAVVRAQQLTPPGGLLLVYGSIFLIAEVRRLLLGEPADPSPLQDPMPQPTSGPTGRAA